LNCMTNENKHSCYYKAKVRGEKQTLKPGGFNPLFYLS